MLLGSALPTHAQQHERLTLIKGIAIFTSDALSSVAYATEETLIAIAIAGTMNAWYSPIIAGIIAAVLFAVCVSYRQIIYAYPNGGGAYTVARSNLGELPGLTAAAALQIDYILTVAVSIAAGVAAIVSGLLFLKEWTVMICIVALFVLMYMNLRGVKEAGKVFFIPTYIFMGLMYLMIAYGVYLKLSGQFPVISYPDGTEFAGMTGALMLEGMTMFVFMRGFAAGCVAMTGSEAISNGIRAFEEPSSKTAAKAIMVMAIVLASLFVGLSLLAFWSGVHPIEGGFPTVLSQVAEALFGRGVVYVLVQASTAAILLLAANTAYQDFPRIYFLLAADSYWPRQFANRGSRLVFSNGIVALTIIASALIILFQANTHSLIPLYAVGVFLCFTLSQSGMVIHWLKEARAQYKQSGSGIVHIVRSTSGFRGKILLNGAGALITFAIFSVQLVTKFIHGAWVLPPGVIGLVLLMKHINWHYTTVANALKINGRFKLQNADEERVVIIATAEINMSTIAQIAFAQHFRSKNVYAVSVTDSEASAEAIKRQWDACRTDIPIRVIVDHYRNIIGSVHGFVKEIRSNYPDQQIDLVIADLGTRWWYKYLHNQTTKRIVEAIKDDPDLTNIVVNLVPFKLPRQVRI